MLQQPLAADSKAVHEGRMESTASDKELTESFQEEAKEGKLQQPLTVVSLLVQERPVASISCYKALTELEAKYAKFQEHLHCTNEENDLLEQYLEKKDSSRVLWIKIL